MDTRRDEGQFYPYGKRVMPTAPTDGDVRHAEFEGIEELPPKFTDEDVRSKMNTLIGTLKGTTAAIAVAFALPLFGAGVTVETARKGEIYNDELVVTNVNFDATGLATTGDIESIRVDVASNRVNIASNAAAISTLTDTTSTLSDSISTLGDTVGDAYSLASSASDSAWEALGTAFAASSDAQAASEAASGAQDTADRALSLANSLAAPRRVAMFVIPVNEGSPFTYKGFELKCSTNNFASSASESVKLQFYSQSEIADEGSGSTIDKMKLFACTSYWSSRDLRSYSPIGNTIDYGNDLYSVVALVDVSCLKRHPEDNGAWLNEDNEDLVWCYMRDTANDVEREVLTAAPLWRPIAPVKWFRELPSWAR